MAGDIFDIWTEPESAANNNVDSVTGEAYTPIYPYNNVTQTESGHLFELDDTPSRERVRLTHRTGTFYEMHPNGDNVFKVIGNGYEIIGGDKKVLVKGNCVITVEGDAYINVKGDKIEKIEGNYELHVQGEYSVMCDQEIEFYGQGGLEMHGAPDPFGLNGSGLTIGSGDHLYFDCDISVNGEIRADKIFAETRIDTGELGGMSAGVQGFVTQLGGVSAGLPIAVPLTVNAATLVNAGVMMTAPLTEFGIMNAMLMTDVVNVPIFDSHIHVSPKGPTGPPVPLMI